MRRGFLASVLAALLLVPSPARAEATDGAELLDLDWEAPAECPARSTILGEVARLVGPMPAPAAASRVTARVRLTQVSEAHWRVQVVTLGASGGERVLEAGSCTALSEATVVILALRIRPDLVAAGALEDPAAPAGPPAVPVPVPPPPPQQPQWPRRTPAPPAGPPPAPRVEKGGSSGLRDFLRVGASARLGLGELPSVDAGGELEVAYAFGRLRVELHGETAFVQNTVTALGADASLRAAGGGGRGCYGPTFGRFTVSGCGEVDLDWMWSQGHGPGQESPSGGFMTLGAGGVASFRFSRRFSVRALMLAEVPTIRPQFVITGTTPPYVLFRPSAAWGLAGLGVEAIIF